MSEKERDRDKAGLHKKISSIFSGVLIPQNSRRMSSSTATPEDKETDSAETQQQAPEVQESESRNTQIIPEPEQAQESWSESTQKVEDKPVSPPKFMMDQESKVVPIEESEIESSEDYKAEPIQETDEEPVHEIQDEQSDTPRFVTAQESKVIPIEES
ncbi:MAG: hypothetical protein RQ760_02795, partial [Sedimentisphaerales bacterium]|nr:hypothetical protein [Sedimentisphaerales bacterium]